MSKPNEPKPNATAYIIAIHPNRTPSDPGYVLRRLEMPWEAIERFTVREDPAEMPQIVISKAESEYYRWHSDSRGRL